MNVTADLPESVIDTIVHHFQARLRADVSKIVSIPGRPNHQIVFGEQAGGNEASYGPQVFVVTHRFGVVELLHATKRMMDTDYLNPAFFGHDDGLLMLADFGAEDSWGLVALHIEPGIVHDYGVLDVVRPGSDFTESAVPVAEVFVENGRYIIKFRGEVTESPGAAPTKWLARQGQRAVFAQIGRRFEYLRAE